MTSFVIALFAATNIKNRKCMKGKQTYTPLSARFIYVSNAMKKEKGVTR